MFDAIARLRQARAAYSRHLERCARRPIDRRICPTNEFAMQRKSEPGGRVYPHADFRRVEVSGHRGPG